MILDAQHDATKAAHELALFTSWHAAAFHRAKKIPPLKEVLRPRISGAALDAKVKNIMAQFRRRGDNPS